MLRNCAYVLLVTMLLSLPAVAADSGEDRLVREHRNFAGSKDNAESLVQGLRNDTAVELVSPNGTTTTFGSPTGKMGLGNVDIALNLAQATLAEQGIRNPSPEQIRAALNGGTVTNSRGDQVKLPGVLELRASGMGWGRIAQELGFKLGEVMRSERAQPEARAAHANSSRPERAERPARAERPERPDRPAKPERPGRS